MAKHLTPEAVDMILQLRAQGLSTKEIHVQLKRGGMEAAISTISERLRQSGLSYRSGRPTKVGEPCPTCGVAIGPCVSRAAIPLARIHKRRVVAYASLGGDVAISDGEEK